MDELIGRLVAEVGVDRGAAEKAIGIILAFLASEAPAEKIKPLIDNMPGAQAALDAAGGPSGMGGIMGVGTRLMAAGLNMSQIQGVTRHLIAFAREKAGEDAVGDVVAAIPGLGQFV